jgi:hypothetical protein
MPSPFLFPFSSPLHTAASSILPSLLLLLGFLCLVICCSAPLNGSVASSGRASPAGDEASDPRKDDRHKREQVVADGGDDVEW